MNKKNYCIFFAILLLTISVVGFCAYSIISKNNGTADGLRFRDEYMELNDKINESTEKEYLDVLISETNTMKYINSKNAIKMIEKGTGIIYFGYATCPLCRVIVPTLTSSAEKNNQKVYYLNIQDMRSSFELGEDGTIKKIKDGTEDYYKILKLLKKELEDLYLVDEAGNRYNTGEKSLTAPTVIGIKDGKVTKIHVGALDSHESVYDPLSSDESKELEKIFADIFASIKEDEGCTPKNC